MQGKEPSERDTKAKSNVGIDVSKSWLDVRVLPSGEALRVGNTLEGVRKLKRWLRRLDLALVVFEATGSASPWPEVCSRTPAESSGFRAAATAAPLRLDRSAL